MYHLSVRIDGGDFAKVEEVTRAALADEGFGILTEIDVAATLKEKLGEEMEPYVILGACNPPMAHRAIEAEPEIGVLLPCNVVVRRVEGAVIVNAMDPESVLSLVESEGVAAVAADVRERLSRVVERVRLS